MMNKFKMIFCLIFCLSFFKVEAQDGDGIKFFDGTYAEALQKAKSDNKILFIDFYATWCGPCKKMASTVFTQGTIGNYFNDKFVCIKIDAERPENVGIADKFGITAFPTLVFVDNEEKAISVNVGAMSEKELLEAAKIATGESVGFSQLYEKYKNDKSNLELQQAMLLKAPAFLAAQEGMDADKWLVRIQKLYRSYIKAKMGPSLINKEDYIIISTLGGGSDTEVNEMIEFINSNLLEWKEAIGNPACYYVVENNDSRIEKLAKDGDSQYKMYLDKIRTDYKDAYSVIKNDNISPYDRAVKYYTALYNLYNSKNVNEYISVMTEMFEMLKDSATPNDYGKAAQDLYYAAGDKLKMEHHKTAIEWVEMALKADNNIMDKINYLVMIGDSYRELKNYALSKQYYNQAYVESLQMSEMEMAQQMVQSTIKRKIATIELLEN